MSTPTHVANRAAAARSPWLAVILSLLATGVGHVYCGRIVRGLGLFGIWLVLPLAAHLAASFAPSTPTLIIGVLIPVALVTCVYVFACFDARRCARRAAPEYVSRDYNTPLVYAALLAVGITYPFLVLGNLRAHAFEAFLVAGGSMAPTLVQGDRVLVNKRRVPDDQGSPAGVRRFDVVAFESPEDPSRRWLKRVAGLPGDTLEIRGGQVLVNGQACAEWTADASDERVEMPETKIPAGTAFLLGDDLRGSKDSRHFGPIALADLAGVVEYVFLPARDWTRLGPLRRSRSARIP